MKQRILALRHRSFRFLQVYKDGDGMLGIVDFALEDDMKYAIRKLDDSEFERGCYVRVKVAATIEACVWM